ncbi:MAG: Clp protease ClpP [Mogibacterium sp.]|nr:Clp protease ClpP [Mogibacterium sp.]
MQKFWNWKQIKNEDEGGEVVERVLEFYGTIADQTWYDDDITPAMFKEELFSGTGPVTIYLNSPGGDCFAASQIYTMLMDYKGPVTVKIDGIAASAASVIAMAGTDVLMAPTAMMMIHNPATIAFGDHKEMEKAIDMLEEVKSAIVNSYEIKTSLPRKTLSKMMDEETWMNAMKAIELGFADGLIEDSKRQTDPEAYSFSASNAERVLINKLTAKAEPETKEEPVPMGRSVDELKASLFKKLL